MISHLVQHRKISHQPINVFHAGSLIILASARLTRANIFYGITQRAWFPFSSPWQVASNDDDDDDDDDGGGRGGGGDDGRLKSPTA